MQVNMHDAKIRLSQLVELAVKGEEVIITISGKPSVKLVPCKPLAQRTFGQFRGQFIVSNDVYSKKVNAGIADTFGM